MFIRIAALGLVFLVGACAERNESSVVEESEAVETSNTGEAFHLKPEELNVQMQLASAGDNEAALRIANHYSLSELRHDQELPWLVLAAERGDIGAMTRLGYRYGSGMYDDTDCTKALQWLERANREGSPAELKRHGVPDQVASITGESGACPRHEP